jgi:ATP-dependent DNA helicase PIF1
MSVRTIFLNKEKITEGSDTCPGVANWKDGTSADNPLIPFDQKDIEFDEECIWQAINSSKGHLVSVSGAAGSGKSNLMRRFCDRCDRSGITYNRTAPTAVAAFNAGGQTWYSALGLGLFDEPLDVILSKMNKYKHGYQRTRGFAKAQLFVVDELSMMDRKKWLKLDILLGKLRGSPKPFGGMKVVVFHDFCQLGPIIRRDEYTPNMKKFAFQTDSWERSHVLRIVLKRVYRQSDPKFVSILNHMRVGILTQEDIRVLRGRIDKEVVIEEVDDADADISVSKKEFTPSDVKLEMSAMELHPKKFYVKNINDKGLKNLCSDGREVYEPNFFISYEMREHCSNMVKKDKEEANRIVAASRNMDDPKNQRYVSGKFDIIECPIALGAQVMLRCNFYFKSHNIYNGSRGIVTALEPGFVHVRFVSKGKFQPSSVKIERYRFKYKVGSSVDVVLTQFPLTLAYAMTIHKCQSLTLDSVFVSSRECFEEGQCYVAFSRVKTLEGLKLRDFDPKSVFANEKAVEFETGKTIDEHRKEILNGMEYMMWQEAQDKKQEAFEREMNSDSKEERPSKKARTFLF